VASYRDSADSARELEFVRHTLIGITLVAMMVMTSYPARADAMADLGGSMFSFNGFGTLGVVHSSDDNADFVGNFSQPNGAGFSRPWSAGVDSRLGLQLDARLTHQLSAVVQVVSQHQYDNHYKPQLEWANLKYQLTPDASVRVGRTVTAFFAVSDSGLVSYTTPWVRPPLEVYGLLPVNHKDGIDASFRFRVWQANNTLRASYGQNDIPIPGGGETYGRRFFDITDTLEVNALTVRAGYATLRLDYDIPGIQGLLDGFTQFGQAIEAMPSLEAIGAQAVAIANRYSLQGIPFRVYTVGATYDPGDWLCMAEWAKAPVANALAQVSAWYVTGGYRVGAFTPYMTFAQIRPKPISEPGISTAGLPPDLAADATGLNEGLFGVLMGFAESQRTVSAGIRWDFVRQAAFKFQYERVSTGANSTGLLVNVQPGFRPGSSISVLSATIDFVF
jgi:hypothetical protein